MGHVEKLKIKNIKKSMKIYLNISNDEDFSSSEVLHKPTWTNHNNINNNKQIMSKNKNVELV